MVSVEYLIFGYRILQVDDGERRTLCNLFLKHRIRAVFHRGSYLVSARDYRALSPHLSDLSVEVSSERGLPSSVRLLFRRYAVTLALIVGLLINVLAPCLVWDVRVSGASSVPEYRIKEALSASGLEVGKLWSAIDVDEIENHLLSDFDGIAWANVNRRGSVAYVTVVEKHESVAKAEQSTAPANIVASADCVIEEISVRRGMAVVEVGDTVRKGEILISGVVTDSEGGTTFCRAEGVVRGKCSGEIEVFLPRTEEVSVRQSTNLAEMRLNIFKFSLNIFKKYRNSSDECVIIEDNDSFIVFGDCRLPVGVTRIYEDTFVTVTKSYTPEQMIAIAERRHSNALRMFLSEAEPLKIKTETGFTDNGYFIRTKVVYSTSVSEEKNIDMQ